MPSRERLTPIRDVSIVRQEGHEKLGESKFALLLSGQGKPLEIVENAKPLWSNFGFVRKMYREADSALDFSLTHASFDKEGQRKLARTEFAQPVIYLASIAAYEVWKSEHEGSSPTYVAGLSVGDYAAGHIAGGYDLIPGLIAVRERAKAMQEQVDSLETTMDAVIKASEEQLQEFFSRFTTIDRCLNNTDEQVVIGGPVADLEKPRKWLAEKKIRTIRLNTNGAFHSRYMTLAKDKIRKAVKDLSIRRLNIGFVRNGGKGTVWNSQDLEDELVDLTDTTFDYNGKLNFLARKAMTQTIELAHSDLSKMAQKKLGGEIQTASTKKGILFGYRWVKSKLRPA